MSHFKKKFPSLAEKILCSKKSGLYELIWIRHIKECCVDKQVVRDLAKRHELCGLVCERIFDESLPGNCVANILAELGL